MKIEYNKSFVASGLIMILMGLLAPLAHKHAAAPFALLQAHLIGEVQALLFFYFAVIPIIIAFFGVLRRNHFEGSGKALNTAAIILFLLIATFAILQTVFPEYSNF